MFSKIFFSCLLCCIGWTAQSQQFSFRFSDKEYNMYNAFANAVPAKNGKIVLQLRNEGFGWIPPSTRIEASLLLINDKIETVKQADVQLQAKNRFIEIKGLYQAEGKTILVYAFKNDRHDKTYTVAAIRIDENTLAASEETELGQFETLSGGELPEYQFEYRLDSAGYLLFVEPVQKSKELKKIQYVLFNSSLTKIAGTTAELPYENRYVTIQSVITDQQDNLFVIYRNYEKEVSADLIANEDDRTPVYETVLLQFSPSAATPAEIKFSLSDYPLHSCRFVASRQTGKLSMAGTYRHSKKGKIKGVFFGEYDPATKTVSNLKTTDFPDELLELCDKDEVGSAKSKNQGLSGNFKAQRLSVRANGSIDFVLEFNNVKESMEYINGKRYSSSQKFSKDIINVNQDKQGHVLFTRIPKNQVSGDRTFLSHFSFYQGRYLIFLYVDSKKNEERDLMKAPEEVGGSDRKTVLMAAKVDEKGNLERTAIFNHSDDDFVTIPLSIRPVSSSVFFVARKKIGSFIGIEHTRIGMMTVK